MRDLLTNQFKKGSLQRWFFFFLSLLFVSLMVLEYREFARTRKLVSGIVSKIISMPNTEGEIGVLKNTLTAVRKLSKPRTDFFRGDLNYSDDYLEAFFSGSGACGMYTLFTCRLLHEMGYTCRVVQQKVNGNWGGHITLEVDLNQYNDAMPARWVLIDPLFAHVFVDSQGNAMSALSVKTHWPQLIKQLPKDYACRYNYQEGFRYTNWDKYGCFTRAIYRLGKSLGAPVETFSFRAVFIRQHFWKLILYCLSLLLTIVFAVRVRLKR